MNYNDITCDKVDFKKNLFRIFCMAMNKVNILNKSKIDFDVIFTSSLWIVTIYLGIFSIDVILHVGVFLALVSMYNLKVICIRFHT